jgi:hypothetical protein
MSVVFVRVGDVGVLGSVDGRPVTLSEVGIEECFRSGRAGHGT